MSAKLYTTMVVMPDNNMLEVSYYCKAAKLNSKRDEVELIIQLHDCTCTLKIERSICNKPEQLEHLVHKKVINTKGHLCE